MLSPTTPDRVDIQRLMDAVCGYFGECPIPVEIFKDLLMHAPIVSQADGRIVGEVRPLRNRAVAVTTYTTVSR